MKGVYDKERCLECDCEAALFCSVYIFTRFTKDR